LRKTRVMLLMGAALALASPALAEPIQVGFSGSPYGPYQTGVGGEFTLNDVHGIPADNWLDLSGYVPNKTSNFGPLGISSFQTFCIEVTEHIGAFDATYNAQINANAVYGVPSSTLNPLGDPVSVGTGWLYSRFARGVLSGYNYTGNRTVSAGLLQNAFWWLEQEGTAYDASNPFMLAAYNTFGGEAGARADGGAAFGVYALNLWSGDGTTTPINRVQDQLYYNGLVSAASVPDGGTTLTLLGMAVVGVAIVSRRLRRS